MWDLLSSFTLKEFTNPRVEVLLELEESMEIPEKAWKHKLLRQTENDYEHPGSSKRREKFNSSLDRKIKDLVKKASQKLNETITE